MNVCEIKDIGLDCRYGCGIGWSIVMVNSLCKDDILDGWWDCSIKIKQDTQESLTKFQGIPFGE